ncbi:MAG: DUF456 domain-containing protein [Paludibacter sp.]|nr:DUF456 domain-containing protein [Bacteroidales bacterium]MCM1069635.1 DUF456 domain-containing protein [Prevotella sp.]MCM1354281.1 DUF456 domain-containing protein [Bacteroides sp.]MCM1443120.1 DUF456 domain-containing protein [Muribaculum sp.]MCM1482355.1 DUF456 domain-containing protein [Paludibacter sp.]
MDILLCILAAVCLLVGLAGCILPAIPGVPLGYVGLLLLQPTERVQYSTTFLLIWAIVVVVIQVLDYIIPAWGTKQFGGSKAGVWGSTFGLIIGLFVGPWGIVLGPFVGAVIFELINGKNTQTAIKAGFGSFVGLLTGTIIKLIACGMMLYYAIAALMA